MQIIAPPYGRLSAAICWDADFPDIIREAGAQDVDLLLLPSNDWFAIRKLHPQMATFRAVENGMAIFRQTGNRVSSVIDQYGRVINRVDMYEEDPDAWGGLQMVDVPMAAVDTFYPDPAHMIEMQMGHHRQTHIACVKTGLCQNPIKPITFHDVKLEDAS